MEPIQKRLSGILSDSLLGLALALGYDLKIFDAVVEAGSEEKPATAAQIANIANLKERYVKEWLSCITCGGFLEVDESGEKFWIKKENVRFLTGPNRDPMFGLLTMVPHFADVVAKVKKVFIKDGPPGMDYEQFGEIHKFIDLVGQKRYQEHLIPDFLPLTEMREKLTAGALALDVGCGTGFQCVLFGKEFPNTTFLGIDSSQEAIAAAKSRKEKENLENVSFELRDASKLPAEWNKRFDWITIFDAYHDQMRPDLSLKEIHRVLKDDGLLTVLEVNGTGNVYTDKQYPQNVLRYAISVFHCLPVGSNSPDALCLGSMWGEPRAKKMLEDTGFKHVKVVQTTFFAENSIFLCRK